MNFSTCTLRFCQRARGLRLHRSSNQSHTCLVRTIEWYRVIMTGEIGNVQLNSHVKFLTKTKWDDHHSAPKPHKNIQKPCWPTGVNCVKSCCVWIDRDVSGFPTHPVPKLDKDMPKGCLTLPTVGTPVFQNSVRSCVEPRILPPEPRKTNTNQNILHRLASIGIPTKPRARVTVWPVQNHVISSKLWNLGKRYLNYKSQQFDNPNFR